MLSSPWPLILSLRVSSILRLLRPHIRLVQISVDFLFVAEGFREEKPGPVDGPSPADDVNGGQHLEQPGHQLRLGPRKGVADAGSDHCAHTGQHDVQDCANVRPHALQARHVRHDTPQLHIGRVQDSDWAFGIFSGLSGKLSGGCLVVSGGLAAHSSRSRRSCHLYSGSWLHFCFFWYYLLTYFFFFLVYNS